MKPIFSLLRRNLLICAAAVLPALSSTTYAQTSSDYPNKPIRIVLSQGPGGLADTTTRYVAQKLSTLIGQSVIIENKPGAGGIIAARTVSTAPADGYTLLLGVTGHVISKSLLDSLPYDMETDFVPISPIADFDLVMLTKYGSDITSLEDIKQLAASQPGGINIGTTSAGSIQNLGTYLFTSAADVPATIVPFKTTAEITVGLINGGLDIGFDTYPGVHAAIEGKQIQAIASTAGERSSVQPEVPTLQELGLQAYEVTGWNALFAPAGTPASVVQYLNEQLTIILSDPETQNRFTALGITARSGTAEELQTLVQRDTQRWAGVIEQFELKAD